MRRFRNQDGFIKAVLCIAIFVTAVYAGFQFGIPYYKYSAFKNEVKDIARQELGNVEKTRARVYESAQDYKIPIEQKDIIVTKTERTVRVKAAWSVDVDIWGIYQKPLEFTVDVEE